MNKEEEEEGKTHLHDGRIVSSSQWSEFKNGSKIDFVLEAKKKKNKNIFLESIGVLGLNLLHSIQIDFDR